MSNNKALIPSSLDIWYLIRQLEAVLPHVGVHSLDARAAECSEVNWFARVQPTEIHKTLDGQQRQRHVLTSLPEK